MFLSQRVLPLALKLFWTYYYYYEFFSNYGSLLPRQVFTKPYLRFSHLMLKIKILLYVIFYKHKLSFEASILNCINILRQTHYHLKFLIKLKKTFFFLLIFDFAHPSHVLTQKITSSFLKFTLLFVQWQKILFGLCSKNIGYIYFR